MVALRSTSLMPSLTQRLEKELASLPCLKGVHRDVVAQLAHKLVDPVHYAAAGAPPLQMKRPIHQPTQTRQRKEGGGRKPNIALAVLTMDLERAMTDLDLSVGWWCTDAGIGPRLQVLQIAWRLATGERLPPDQRRAAKAGQSWKRHP